MERKIILKNTESGQELSLPVTPEQYPMASGRTVERLDMAVTGQVALPGLKGLFSEQLQFMLPAQLYPFCTPGAVADPKYYLDILTQWSANADVCRDIVVGAGVNSPVLLGEVSYREEDGSNDVYVTIPLYEYRYLEEAQIEQLTENSVRVVETSAAPTTAEKYTVARGDSLWAICKKFYGDGSLAYKLATANNIKNPNLIYTGQTLELPDLSTLKGLAATPAPAVTKAAQKVSSTANPNGYVSVASLKKSETTAEATSKARLDIGLYERFGLTNTFLSKQMESRISGIFSR